jgi:hypothetical protein
MNEILGKRFALESSPIITAKRPHQLLHCPCIQVAVRRQAGEGEMKNRLARIRLTLCANFMIDAEGEG